MTPPLHRLSTLRRSILDLCRASVTCTTAGTLCAATWTGSSGGWDDPSAWSPSVPDGSGTIADFSRVDYLARTTINLNGERTVGQLTLGDAGTPIQTVRLRPGSGESVLVFDNGGSGATPLPQDTTSAPPPAGFNQPPGPATHIDVPVSLADDLTITNLSGPVPGSLPPWFGVFFDDPMTETGGPHSLTIDGNGRGMTGMDAAWQLSGGVTVNAGSFLVGVNGELGTSPVTVAAGAQLAWFGDRTIANDMTLAGNGFLELAGDRGALSFRGSEFVVTGAIQLVDDTRIEGDATAEVRLAGPISGGHDLRINGLVGGQDLQDRSGTFILEGDASGLTGTLEVQRGALQLGPASRPGGGVELSVVGTLSGETEIAGDLTLGTPAPDGPGRSILGVDPTTPEALHVAGDLSLNQTTEIALAANPTSSPVRILSYGGTLSGGTPNLALPGGPYRPGTAFDLTTVPGELLLEVDRSSLVWNAGTASWNTTGTTWTGGDTFHQFDNVTFDDSVAGGGMITIEGDLRPGVITVDNSSGNDFVFNAETGTSNAPLANSIAAGGLVKSGSGELTIGIDNAVGFNQHTFPGGTIINAGRVRVLQNGDAGRTTGPLGVGTITLNGGALSGRSAFGLSLYNDLVIAADAVLGETGEAKPFSVASRVILAADATITTESGVSLGKGNDPDTGVLDLGGGHRLTKAGAGYLDLRGGSVSSWTGTTTVAEGVLQVGGTLSCGDTLVEAGASLVGIGRLEADVAVAPGAVIAPGTVNSSVDSAGFAIAGDVDIDGTYACGIERYSRDHLMVDGILDIGDATLEIEQPNGPVSEPEVHVIASYTSLVGGAFASVVGLPPLYEIDYAHDDGTGSHHIALVKRRPYEVWAGARGLEAGVDDAPDFDANGDGVSNLEHFAHDTDPLGAGGSEGKRRSRIVADGDAESFTLTLPVRTGASFSGTPLTALRDGVSYQVEGSSLLVDTWPLEVVELTPALSDGLPALGDYDGVPGAEWEYRTFRLGPDVSTLARGFLRSAVSEAP